MNNSSSFKIQGFTVHPVRNEIQDGSLRIRLTPKEMGVLVTLYTHANETITREKILNRVWGSDHGNDLGLTQAVSRLRKIFKDRTSEEVIATIPKVGYRLENRESYPVQTLRQNSAINAIGKYKKTLMTLFIVLLSLVVFWLMFNRRVVIKKRIIVPALQHAHLVPAINTANQTNAPLVLPAYLKHLGGQPQVPLPPLS